MLFLICELGRDRYAVDARQVAEILPLVGVKQLPQAPPAVAGLLNYRGAPVPVIDLSPLTLGRAAAPRLSTRIVLIHYGADRHLLGLIAERATEVLRRNESDFVPSGVVNDEASYLGPVATDGRGLVQRLDLERLLPDAVRDMLFKASMAKG